MFLKILNLLYKISNLILLNNLKNEWNVFILLFYTYFLFPFVKNNIQREERR